MPTGSHEGARRDAVSADGPPRLVQSPAERERAVAILVEAFYEDPTWACAFPDPDRRREQQRWMWGLFVAGAVRYSFVWLNHDEVAVSVWIPPGGTELSPDQEGELEPGLRDLLGPGADRVLHALELFDAHHPHDAPHHYLSFLATDPAHRGHGHGLRLLGDNLAVLDRLGSPAYLEASNPANVSLYERFGFAVHGHFEPFADGPVVTTMWREPV
jgi:GNAT superfamily N-acetyltransferase